MNQPLTETAPGQPVVTFTYDALGRRFTRGAAGSTETYSYVGSGIGRIDRGGENVTDPVIDAMGDRLTVGGAWTIPNARGDAPQRRPDSGLRCLPLRPLRGQSRHAGNVGQPFRFRAACSSQPAANTTSAPAKGRGCSAPGRRGGTALHIADVR